MDFGYFVAKRISYRSERSFSKNTTRIAVVAIALSIAIMIASDAIVVGFQSEIKNKITGFASHIQVSKTRTNLAFDNEPILIDTFFEKKVTQMPSVRHIQTFAQLPGIIKTPETSEGIVLKGVDTSFDWQAFSPNIILGKGNITFNDSMPSDDMILSSTMADKLSLKMGDTIFCYFFQKPLRYRPFIIKALYKTEVEEIDEHFALVDIKHLRQLQKWDDNQIGGYQIFLNDDAKANKVNNEIREELLSDSAHMMQEAKTTQQRFPQIYDWLGLLNTNIQVILFLLTAVAAINMITALLVLILERSKMIGILKVLGARNWQVQRIFVINASLIILGGMLAGNVLAFSLLLAQQHFHILQLSAESYYLSNVPVQFRWWSIALINIGAFVFCSLAMFLPSLFVLWIRPVKVLRFE